MTENQTLLQPSIEVKRTADSLFDCVDWLCAHYGTERSRDSLMSGLPRGNQLSPSLALTALENAGLTGGIVERGVWALPAQLMPMILLRKDSGGAIYLERKGSGKEARHYVVLPEISNKPVVLTHDEMMELYAGSAILAKPRAKIDERAGQETPRSDGHWLWSTLWRYRRYYRSAAIAAVLINVLALASTFFTMNVYDRIVPNQAYASLWSLAIGVAVAMLFEAITRQVRAHVLDVAGKKADLVMGSILFRQAMAIRMEHRPSSSGSFANQLREFESIRDFATSATLATLTDLPMVLLFVGVLFSIGGALGWIPLLMIPVIIAICVAIQWPLSRAMKENLRESSLKQGVLIESIEGLETLKAVGGAGYMQRRWEQFSALASATSMKSRRLSALASNTVTALQQLQTVMLVVTGVYLIGDGKLTQGALIGTVMLASRATAPLGQVVGLAVRFQQAKAALTSLSKLMKTPIERDNKRAYLPKPPLRGQVQLKDVDFTYPQTGAAANPPSLKKINLSIQPGERVGVIGRVGSGKSTLLRVIAHLYRPTKGQLFTDGIDLEQIDPADWRRSVGYVGQETRLFYGSLRENIMLGRPDATAQEFLAVLRLVGLDVVAAAHPSGVNLQVGEGGQNLSGGQRQLVSLARTLIAQPDLLLMDEPTSAMDTQTESIFIEHLLNATQGKSLMVVTHRPSVLVLVDRIVVVDQGSVVADGPKKEILAQLMRNSEREQMEQQA